MGRRKLTKKRKSTSISLDVDLYNTLIKKEENISKYLEGLIIADLVNKGVTWE
jgi:hypothetical protein